MAEKIKNFYGSGNDDPTKHEDRRVKTEGGKKVSEPKAHDVAKDFRGGPLLPPHHHLPPHPRHSLKLTSLLRRAELKEREFKSRRLVAEFPSSIDNFRHWRVFNWQENGFEDIEAAKRRDLHLFSFETAFGEVDAKGNSRRKFLVTSFEELWHYYRQLAPDKRHFYEIIPQNGVCKMYFDVEFPKKNNEEKNPTRVMDAFFEALCPYIAHELGVSVDKSDFLDLDSSTSAKFSRHVILARGGNILFLNNRHLGKFVDKFMKVVEMEWRKKKKKMWISFERDGKEQVRALEEKNITMSIEDETRVDRNGVTGLYAEEQTGVDGEEQTGVDGEEQTGVDGEEQTGVDGEEQTGVDGEEQTGVDAIDGEIGAPKSSFEFPDGVLGKLDELFYVVEEKTEGDDEVVNEERGNEIGSTISDDPRKFEGLSDDVNHVPLTRLYNESSIDCTKSETENDVDEVPLTRPSTLAVLRKKITSIIDGGVYTKNRAFRLYLSSKAAKKQPLVVSEDNRFVIERGGRNLVVEGEPYCNKSSVGRRNEKARMAPVERIGTGVESERKSDAKENLETYASVINESRIGLAKQLDGKKKLERAPEKDGSTVELSTKSTYRKDLVETINDENEDSLRDFFMASLICNVNPDDTAKLISYDGFSASSSFSTSSSSSATSSTTSSSTTFSSSTTPTNLDPPSHSPYPKIDSYISNHVILDSRHRGSIRRSAFFADTKILIYDVKDYRFCRRVGRHHSSNNIQIVVDVVIGTWYQRCLDPECKGFRSNGFPIPRNVLRTSTSAPSSALTSALKEEAFFCGELEDEEMDDDALLAEVIKFEADSSDQKDSSDGRTKRFDASSQSVESDDFSSDDELFCIAAQRAACSMDAAESKRRASGLAQATLSVSSQPPIEQFSDEDDFIQVSSVFP